MSVTRNITVDAHGFDLVKSEIEKQGHKVVSVSPIHNGSRIIGVEVEAEKLFEFKHFVLKLHASVSIQK
jgi:predicted CoA-binding protein